MGLGSQQKEEEEQVLRGLPDLPGSEANMGSGRA